MKMHKVLFLLAVVLLSSSTSRAQDVTVTFLDQRAGIRLQLDPATLPPPGFVKVAEQISNYTLYEVETPDPDKMCKFSGCINEIPDILDPQKLPHCDDVCRRIELYFAPGKHLDLGKNFILVVQYF